MKPEQCSQNPRVQKEAELSEKTRRKALYKGLLGDDPGGRLGRAVNYSPGTIHRRKEIFFTSFIGKTSIPTKTSKTQKKSTTDKPTHTTKQKKGSFSLGVIKLILCFSYSFIIN